MISEPRLDQKNLANASDEKQPKPKKRKRNGKQCLEKKQAKFAAKVAKKRESAAGQSPGEGKVQIVEAQKTPQTNKVVAPPVIAPQNAETTPGLIRAQAPSQLSVPNASDMALTAQRLQAQEDELERSKKECSIKLQMAEASLALVNKNKADLKRLQAKLLEEEQRAKEKQLFEQKQRAGVQALEEKKLAEDMAREEKKRAEKQVLEQHKQRLEQEAINEKLRAEQAALDAKKLADQQALELLREKALKRTREPNNLPKDLPSSQPHQKRAYKESWPARDKSLRTSDWAATTRTSARNYPVTSAQNLPTWAQGHDPHPKETRPNTHKQTIQRGHQYNNLHPKSVR